MLECLNGSRSRVQRPNGAKAAIVIDSVLVATITVKWHRTVWYISLSVVEQVDSIEDFEWGLFFSISMHTITQKLSFKWYDDCVQCRITQNWPLVLFLIPPNLISWSKQVTSFLWSCSVPLSHLIMGKSAYWNGSQVSTAYGRTPWIQTIHLRWLFQSLPPQSQHIKLNCEYTAGVNHFRRWTLATGFPRTNVPSAVTQDMTLMRLPVGQTTPQTALKLDICSSSVLPNKQSAIITGFATSNAEWKVSFSQLGKLHGAIKSIISHLRLNKMKCCDQADCCCNSELWTHDPARELNANGFI